ncbi:protein shisa-5 isoform X1 [Drosophila sulfurigaster albostrigata]|uniref:protein shisa-5 isoform X1 n=1 Tax=Drosophila sulfurigaster albostrigata TaxID=89887 RepID=UPI002D218393|nr:protein shisa-5 isoform X1 [Drosophila sulfurigaster albostrigata]
MHTPITLFDQGNFPLFNDPRGNLHPTASNDFFDSFPRDNGDRFFCGFALFVFAIIIGACCLNCCCLCYKRRQLRKHQLSGHSFCNSPVVVTSATHTAPGGYPVTTVPARTYQTTTYATPYPAQTTGPNLTVQMPMPMPTTHSPMPGVQQPQGAPYPPVQQYPGANAANMNPPSYDAAMANSSPSVAAPGYEKQMPYNPNY